MQNLVEMVSSYSKVAENKMCKGSINLLFSGVLSGFFIAIGGYASQVLNYKLNNAALGSLVFPLGLFLVVTLQTELFTGNCLLFIKLFQSKSIKEFFQSLSRIIRNFIIVYISNSFGAHIFAIIIYKIELDPNMRSLIISAAVAKVNKSPEVLFYSAIMCNIIVCLAVFLATNVSSIIEKFCAVYMAIYIFVLCGFEHCVANMYTVFIGLLFSENNVLNYWYNLFYVTLGNLFGGILISLLLVLTTKTYKFIKK